MQPLLWLIGPVSVSVTLTGAVDRGVMEEVDRLAGEVHEQELDQPQCRQVITEGGRSLLMLPLLRLPQRRHTWFLLGPCSRS